MEMKDGEKKGGKIELLKNGKKHPSTNVEQSWAKLLILLMHTVTN